MNDAQTTRLRFSGGSDAGKVRAVNQDSFFVDLVMGQGLLALVADGMGGHRTGEVASQKAVKIISRDFRHEPSYPPAALAKALRSANLEIYGYASQNPENRGMGTTLTALYLDDQFGIIGHVGDSRAYLIRNGGIQQLSDDHSWVAERVRQGLLTEDQAKRHRWRNVITSALGSSKELRVDFLGFGVRQGDRFLICSDGVSMLLDEETLRSMVSEHDPKEAVRLILSEADERGSPDNITAIVVAVDALEAQRKSYELKNPGAPVSVNLTHGTQEVEEAFPLTSLLSKLKRHPYYPYRFWLGGSALLLLLILFFAFR